MLVEISSVLTNIFQSIFFYMYPLIHNHPVSHLFFLAIFVFLAWWLWRYLRRSGKTSSFSAKIVKFLLYVLEVLIVLFILWFIVERIGRFMF